MNTKPQPQPFDLQAALDGAPIMTRDGINVRGWHYFDKVQVDFPIIAFLDDDEPTEYDIVGNCAHSSADNRSLDLVMKPKEPKTVTKYILWGGNDHFGMWVVRTSDNKDEIDKAKEYQEATQPKGFFVISETIVTLPE